jgi:hypothetical protein
VTSSLARGLSAADESDADGVSPPDALRGAHDPTIENANAAAG